METKMKNKQIIGLVVAAAVFTVTGIASVKVNNSIKNENMHDSVNEIIENQYAKRRLHRGR